MATSSLNIVILAAGKGTRMYSRLPKVLHEIGGISMLERVIHTAQSLNPDSISVVIGHGKELVRQRIQANVHWVEQDQQLGTGHAVKMALPNLADSGRTLILYGDVPLIDQQTLADLLSIAGEDVALLTDVLDNPTGYGRIIRQQGNVVAIVEEKDASAAEKAICETNTGIFVLPNRKLAQWLNALQNHNAQQEYYLTDVIALAQHDKIPVHPLQVRVSWLAAGVNNKLQLAQLERILQQQQANALLQAGVTLRDPARFDLRGQLKHGQDVIIDVNVVLEGNIELGDNVSIGANCVIKNATIGAGTVIQPNSHLDNCVIGSNAQIGPFARLRPQAQIGDAVHIGNFVEVKNSTIGYGSKANHLTYLGDATIGEQTNIGAGTITCNYDGVNKYRTVIGNQVRIGSGNMLVAPITIGDRATTGAGSTLSRNCPPDKLTLARSRQTTLNEWQRPEKKTQE
ncbi:bifunctional UDP-N-acetylglucosamine diphosphorylase/glucosamine-1-phosphate N-acetyltransferase GlmU [Snodgrassella sp. B3800]|uniref:bifunctional UDP-N-acetylglucosamine diphosphorylase/glucosamine-1-phosphate N-acetyltransferase GlmU n=1 Tax=Snodgrassella sp. B3800 TaxID=2818039 RepID=UPI00226A10B2|nr:bifunctional UDP-N-acetylglucosamine diphosphorylase/glucosamine-1-phosphate N-acetyltransferase GlmU [Snodgrassella sp. B3800]MCX8747410.1 bifunctional UDP-N-acetylglucosamine diphosphorylase/glucosamine-1-phosphate N-acetyltransferase GlmU [Snodgrassella sp. B3800]